MEICWPSKRGKRGERGEPWHVFSMVKICRIFFQKSGPFFMYYYPNYSDMGPQKVANSNGNPRIFQGMLWLCMTSIKTCQMLGESGMWTDGLKKGLCHSDHSNPVCWISMPAGWQKITYDKCPRVMETMLNSISFADCYLKIRTDDEWTQYNTTRWLHSSLWSIYYVRTRVSIGQN